VLNIESNIRIDVEGNMKRDNIGIDGESNNNDLTIQSCHHLRVFPSLIALYNGCRAG